MVRTYIYNNSIHYNVRCPSNATLGVTELCDEAPDTAVSGSSALIYFGREQGGWRNSPGGHDSHPHGEHSKLVLLLPRSRHFGVWTYFSLAWFFRKLGGAPQVGGGFTRPALHTLFGVTCREIWGGGRIMIDGADKGKTGISSSPTMTFLHSWQLVGRRNTKSLKQWVRTGLAVGVAPCSGKPKMGRGGGARGSSGASLKERWKKFSTLLLRMNIRERLNFRNDCRRDENQSPPEHQCT